ncbi:DEAD/DEAH box helicase family protein [Allobacillus sp. GCM10007491]|uniref:DEAD/DEAH box helicase family protein n=1 Tax=Allobacillus saliphilus TaxID=2912308 RepID=A0A941CTG5_9BACI|nr:DEAD/DEAH box helicase family protein [Allobacillus saliphilus]MBR7553622.1 DEAD/DEAH box helicase family protein [Allobacillus saliphilus]
MAFTDLDLSFHYRTGGSSGDIINDFYVPVLSEAKIYKRAVGYFTSNSLAIAAKGLSSFIKNGGKMQLIASPHLNKEDIEAINQGYKARDEVLNERLIKELEFDAEDKIIQERLNYLAWLVYNNQLDIKIAVLKDQTSLGIYHEKLGILEDVVGNKIAFSGSSNETEGGLVNNYEAIDVFFSWDNSDEKRVTSKEQAFSNLWTNSNSQLEIIDFPDAVKDKLLKYRKNTYSNRDPEVKNNEIKDQGMGYQINYPRIPDYIKLREYQIEAIKSWFKNSAQGLLEMATGTGKTITAISAVSKLYENTGKLAVVIACPYTHLVNQWVEDLKKFNMAPIIAYGGKNWEETLNDQITSFNYDIINHFCVITTNDTFSSEKMQNQLRNLKSDTVFVADEAHHLGAKYLNSKLIDAIPYRLALSATPNRWYDDEGTDKLLKYFGGKTVYQFGLDQAIGRFLTEYFYYPHIVYLDEDESEEYYEITRKLVKTLGSDDLGKSSEIKEKLLIKRARILSSARKKIDKLNELMGQSTESKYNIVYCGDSDVDGEKQLDKVIKMLGNRLGMKVHSFTAREDHSERKELLERFSEGDLQALVAIKCLDEGVDVPATQNAYILASSTNPREFIQRRGRVLRKHKGKQYSYIHDFIILPRNIDEISELEPALFNMERNLLKRELKRLTEFANLAMNGPEAIETLADVTRAYNLLDV